MTNLHASKASTSRSEDPRIAENADIDIVIVGAGVIGVASALRLSQQGLRVLVVDPDGIGQGASLGNAGHIATEQVFPPADKHILRELPRMLLDSKGPLRLDWRYFPKALPWFLKLLPNLRDEPYHRNSKALQALNERSLSAWQALLGSISKEHLLHSKGNLLVYEKEDSYPAAIAMQQKMAAYGVDSNHLSAEEVLEREPSLSNNLRGGLYFSGTGHVVNPLTVVQALAEAAEKQGVTFLRSKVEDASLHSEGVRLETRDSKSDRCSLKAKHVLIACGAFSAPLVKRLTGIRVPLDTERGYHLMLPHESERLDIPVASMERKFIMTPMQDGLRVVGTVEFAGLQRPANVAKAWQLKEHASALFQSHLNTSDASPWMGFRPSLPDALPVIDTCNDARVVLAFGHQHLGLTQAAVTADTITSLLIPTADQPELDLTPYRLSRFHS